MKVSLFITSDPEIIFKAKNSEGKNDIEKQTKVDKQ